MQQSSVMWGTMNLLGIPQEFRGRASDVGNRLLRAGMGLTAIPEWLGDLTALTHLHRRDNRPTEVLEAWLWSRSAATGPSARPASQRPVRVTPDPNQTCPAASARVTAPTAFRKHLPRWRRFSAPAPSRSAPPTAWPGSGRFQAAWPAEAE
jgi:hypothetical protein